MRSEHGGQSNGLLIGLLVGGGGVFLLGVVAFVGLYVIGRNALQTAAPATPPAGTAMPVVFTPPPPAPVDLRRYETPVIYDEPLRPFSYTAPATNPFNFSGWNP